jgi:D-alanyl-D-alanine dipeptidase
MSRVQWTSCLRASVALLISTLVSSQLLAQSSDNELVSIKQLIPDIVLDIRYNSTDNFTAQKLYSTDEALLAHGMVKRLKPVQDSLRIRGLGLKIYDGYRPRAIQYLMYEIYPNPAYVANPATGSIHNRGAAIDLSIVNLSTGLEIPMPTRFDWFGPEAGHGYTGNLTAEQIANRELLRTMMENVGGFTRYDAEWWHYTYGPLVGLPLLDFQMK